MNSKKMPRTKLPDIYPKLKMPPVRPPKSEVIETNAAEVENTGGVYINRSKAIIPNIRMLEPDIDMDTVTRQRPVTVTDIEKAMTIGDIKGLYPTNVLRKDEYIGLFESDVEQHVIFNKRDAITEIIRREDNEPNVQIATEISETQYEFNNTVDTGVISDEDVNTIINLTTRNTLTVEQAFQDGYNRGYREGLRASTP